MTPRAARSIVMSLVFFLAVLALGGWFLWERRDQFEQVSLVSWPMLIALAALFVVRMSLRGVFQWQAMRSLGADIGFKDAIALCYIGLMLNTLLPMPVGVAYRAAYMKRVHGLSFGYFASTMAVLFLAGLFVSSALGLAAVVWIWGAGSPVRPEVVLLLAGVSLATLAALAVRWRSTGDHWLARRTRKLTEGWGVLINDRRLLAGGVLLVLGSAAVNVLAMNVAFESYGHSLGGTGAFLLMSSQQLGGLIRLTPGAIGYQESVSAYFATMLEVTSVQALVVLATTRAVNILVSIALGLPSLAAISLRAPAAGEDGVA